jgi:hypothetical protein
MSPSFVPPKHPPKSSNKKILSLPPYPKPQTVTTMTAAVNDPKSLVYAPTEISAYGKRYLLHKPLVCPIKYITEDKYYSIEHDGLNIFCGGDTVVEACQEFNEWFVHTYQYFNEIGESHLCGEYLSSLCLINQLVKQEK